MLDTTIVNVSLPYIGKDLGGTTSSLQWVVDSYTLLFAALLLTSGTACDRLGTRYIYCAGLITFAIFSFSCALSTSMCALIIFRAFQGIGAAMVVPSSLVLIAEMYSDHIKRTKIIGLWGAAGGIAAALGPILGGMLVSAINWNAAFWINIPIIAVLIVLIIGYVPSRQPDNNKRFDLWGQVTSILGLSAITYLVITWGERGWNSLYIAWLIGGIMLVLCFFIIESATPDPMLPLALFKERRFRIALFVGFCLNFSFFRAALYPFPLLPRFSWLVTMVVRICLSTSSNLGYHRFASWWEVCCQIWPISSNVDRTAPWHRRFFKPDCGITRNALSSDCTPHILRGIWHGFRYASSNLGCC
jgi:drug resistance MFS transporter, drug:H+ antiporter-2 (14 spanner) (DHA2) family protein